MSPTTRGKVCVQMPLSLKGSTKTSILCTKSTTCYPQLPEYLTVRNSQKQTVAKAAGLCTPFNNVVTDQTCVSVPRCKRGLRIFALTETSQSWYSSSIQFNETRDIFDRY